MKFRLGLAIALFSFVVIFSVQNAEVVDVRLLFWTVSMSRALVLFFAALLGALVCWLAGAVRHSGGTPR